MIKEWLLRHRWVNELGKLIAACGFIYFAAALDFAMFNYNALEPPPDSRAWLVLWTMYVGLCLIPTLILADTVILFKRSLTHKKDCESE